MVATSVRTESKLKEHPEMAVPPNAVIEVWINVIFMLGAE